jgi:hypothetical protein
LTVLALTIVIFVLPLIVLVVPRGFLGLTLIILSVPLTVLVVPTMNLNLILTGMGDFMVFGKNDLFEYICFFDVKFVQKEEFSLNLMVLKKAVTIF